MYTRTEVTMTATTAKDILTAGPRKVVTLIQECENADVLREALNCEKDSLQRAHHIELLELAIAKAEAEDVEIVVDEPANEATVGPDGSIVSRTVAQDLADSLSPKARESLRALSEGLEVRRVHSSIRRMFDRREMVDDTGLTARGWAVCEALGFTAAPETQPEPAPEPEPEVMPEPIESTEPVEPVVEAAPEEAEPTDAEVCAKAFLAALARGDAGLVAATLAEIANSWGSSGAKHKLAQAMVGAVSQCQAKSARKRREPGTPSPLSMDRIKKAVAGSTPRNAAGEPVVIVIKLSDGPSFGWPNSWCTYASNWSPSMAAGAAARKMGWSPRFSVKNGTVTLTGS